MSSLQIKICGLRSTANIRELSRLEIDLMGLIFYAKSARFVQDAGLAARLKAMEDLPPKVGVFVQASLEEIKQRVEEFHLDYVQLHGDESPDFCRNLKGQLPETRLIKVFRIDQEFDFSQCADFEEQVSLFLFDTKSTAYGGTGRRFNWSLLHQYTGETPFLLSGGIGPEQAEAVNTFKHPRLKGLDLNSRFEERPGLKDVRRIRSFLNDLNTNT